MFEVESVDGLAMEVTDDGMTIVLCDIDGGTILLAGLTDILDAGGFCDLEWDPRSQGKHRASLENR